MDCPVAWSPEAIEDLESIAEYIGRDSGFYARAVVTKVLNVARAIPDFPMMGRRVPELDDENVRERLVYSYRVVYKIESGRILIVAVIHGKRECLGQIFSTTLTLFEPPRCTLMPPPKNFNACQGIPNRVIHHNMKSVTHHGFGKSCPE